MFSNYIKTAWRTLSKNKVFSLINILGLTIGITVCMMIYLFIMNEFSVDKFHKNGDHIYRVMRGIEVDSKSMNIAYLSGMQAPALLNDFKGQIVSAVRVGQNDNLFSVGSKSFHEKKELDVDPGFFSMFSFPLIKGSASDALNDLNSVVLTESTAKKYFGSAEEAMGKIINMNKTTPLKVTGVAKDPGPNSHLDFDIVTSLERYKEASWMTNWVNNGVYTYVQLAPTVPAAQIEKAMPAFVEKYMGAELRKFGFHWNLSLTPLKDVYFDAKAGDNVKHGDKTVVYIFLSIAILILLIACINFMNLSTIRAAERSKEVGLRKVFGAMRNSLVRQFIGESVLLTTMACLLSVAFLLLVMPWYNQLLGYALTVSWHEWPIYLFLIGIILVVGFLAGSYPAFFLSAFSPIQALKGKLKLGRGASSFRQALVVVQFSISAFLIIGTIIITKQMNYVKSKQLGYNDEQIIVIPIDNGDIYKNLNRFKTGLQAETGVHSVSVVSGEPGGFFDSNTFEVEGHVEKQNASTECADFELVKTLGLNIIAGRDFSAAYPTDSTDAVLINKTAASKFGWTPEQAVGKSIFNLVRDANKRRIVGVVEDFNFQSLKQNINALVISPIDDKRQILVKLNAGNLQSNLDMVKNAYAKAAPAYPFEYRFLNEQFENLYRKDIRQQHILSVFAGLAIFVACLGLFGLASFTANKRFHEIGVRKVIGASSQSIVLLLSKDLLKPVFIATCIALPAGYWAMHQWLQNFAYKTGLDWWIFLLAAIITFGIALLTVSVKAVKAAMANPVKSLRSE